MICLEIKFNEAHRFDMDHFLVKNGILFFEKCYDTADCLKLYVQEKEKEAIRKKLEECSFVKRVRNISVEELMI